MSAPYEPTFLGDESKMTQNFRRLVPNTEFHNITVRFSFSDLCLVADGRAGLLSIEKSNGCTGIRHCAPWTCENSRSEKKILKVRNAQYRKGLISNIATTAETAAKGVARQRAPRDGGCQSPLLPRVPVPGLLLVIFPGRDVLCELDKLRRYLRENTCSSTKIFLDAP